MLARALPSWEQEDSKLSAGKNGVPAAAWRTGGAVAGPVGHETSMEDPHWGRNSEGRPIAWAGSEPDDW